MEIKELNQQKTTKTKSNYTGNKPNNTRKTTKNQKQGSQAPKNKGYVIPKITEEELNQTYITTLGDLINLLDYGTNHDHIIVPNQKLTRAISNPELKKHFLSGYFTNELPIMTNKIISSLSENCTAEEIIRKTAEFLANKFINSKYIYFEM